MVIAQIALDTHPEPKEFSASFSSTKAYSDALPAYQDHLLTHLRNWWVANYSALRFLFFASFVGLAMYGLWYWLYSKGEQHA
ncbi:hypothetical protein KUL49_41330 [Alteromonas sp. KUL49]|nr:hypothetical protein KUL49_41330 [Alteromonas sp. KUL49]